MKTKTHIHYILFYKPYGVLSQFTPESGHRSLKDFGPFPKGVYPVGRLDVDSEGLMLLTNDNRVKHGLASPTFRHKRSYFVQVERVPTESSLEKLREGVMIEGRRTLPSVVRLLHQEPSFPSRPVPIRFRKNLPTCWLEITLTEGRNRQVRKMTAAIGHPTLRLVRTHISFLSLNGLAPGETRGLDPKEISRLMKLVEDLQ
jgi:23S rRNA pseudouridine2457 synthase